MYLSSRPVIIEGLGLISGPSYGLGLKNSWTLRQPCCPITSATILHCGQAALRAPVISRALYHSSLYNGAVREVLSAKNWKHVGCFPILQLRRCRLDEQRLAFLPPQLSLTLFNGEDRTPRHRSVFRQESSRNPVEDRQMMALDRVVNELGHGKSALNLLPPGLPFWGLFERGLPRRWASESSALSCPSLAAGSRPQGLLQQRSQSVFGRSPDFTRVEWNIMRHHAGGHAGSRSNEGNGLPPALKP